MVLGGLDRDPTQLMVSAPSRPNLLGTTHTTLLLMALASFLLAVTIPLEIVGWTGLSGFNLFVVVALTAWVVRRRSLLVALYLGETAIYFGLTSIVLGLDRQPALVGLVIVWALGMALGAFLVPAKRATTSQRQSDPPPWTQFVLTAALIAIQAYLVLSGEVGYEAQITSGLSVTVGVLGVLATVAPVVSLMLLIAALRSECRVRSTALVAAIEAAVLSLSGFRGAAVTFTLAIGVAGAVALPASSSWRRPARVAGVAVLLTLVLVLGFTIGANVKNSAATRLGVSSEGTQLFSLDQAPTVIFTRLDLGPALDKAIQLQDVPSVQSAVSWQSQLEALIPRLLWPDKPIVDYGQQVSIAVYGYSYLQITSSTISTVGDTLINFKIAGVIIGSLLLGFALSLAEKRIRAGEGLASIVLVAALSYALPNAPGPPLILAFADVLRNILVAGVLWKAVDTIHQSMVITGRTRLEPERSSRPSGGLSLNR